MRSLLLSSLFFLLFSAFGQINQQSQRIRYFSPHTSPTVWDGTKSTVYNGGGASVSNVGSALPVELIDGIRAIKLETTKPSGYWNTIFKIGVHEVNYNRMGDSPFLYLRVKWTSIAANADMEIEIQSYEDLRHLNNDPTQESAKVFLWMNQVKLIVFLMSSIVSY